MSLTARALSGTIAVVSALAVAVPAAQASTWVPNPCQAVGGSQAFASWGDSSFYSPVPGGSFESGARGWSLAGAASVVADDGPLTSGAKALELRPGASATSPVFCVGIGYPYSRMFARGGGTLKVDVVRPAGAATQTAGTVGSGTTWAPTRRFSMSQGLTNSYGTLVQLRFTAVWGTTRIDDVLVDPRLSR